jgi:hypothetical protein
MAVMELLIDIALWTALVAGIFVLVEFGIWIRGRRAGG